MPRSYRNSGVYKRAKKNTETRSRARRSGVRKVKGGISFWFASSTLGLVTGYIAVDKAKTGKTGETEYKKTFCIIEQKATGASGIATAFEGRYGWTVPDRDLYINLSKNVVQSIRAIERYKKGR